MYGLMRAVETSFIKKAHIFILYTFNIMSANFNFRIRNLIKKAYFCLKN